MNDDTAARKARADALHQQIDRLIKQGDKGQSEPAISPDRCESPAEFVQRKMRELEEKEKK